MLVDLSNRAEALGTIEEGTGWPSAKCNCLKLLWQ